MSRNETALQRYRDQLDRLIRSENYFLAAALCGCHREMQEYVMSNAITCSLEINEEKIAPEIAEIHKLFRIEKTLESYVAESRTKIRRKNDLGHGLLKGLRIIYVDDPSSISVARKAILPQRKSEEPFMIVSMDCEWEPVKSSPVSIIQLSTAHDVVILDLQKLMEKEDAAMDYISLLRELFYRKDMLIVGFSLQSDFSRLFATLPQLTHNPHSILLIEELAARCDVIDRSSSKKLGLSTLAKHVLGIAALDKTQQVSNWTRRPLSPAQLKYACLDAIVCYRMFEVLSRNAPSTWSGAVHDTFHCIDVSSSPADESSMPPLSGSTVRSMATALITGQKPLFIQIANLDDCKTRKHITRHFESDVARKEGDDEPSDDIVSCKTLCLASGKDDGQKSQNETFFVVVLEEHERVNLRLLAKHAGLGTRLRLASRNEMIRVFGYPAGSVPAWGHRCQFTTFVSSALFSRKPHPAAITIGGGHSTLACVLTLAQLMTLTRGKVVPLIRRASATALENSEIFDVVRKKKLEANPLAKDARRWYPDISMNPLRRFVVTCEMAKLMRHLRVIGVDTAYFPTKNDEAVVALASREKRVIITKDRKLAARSCSNCAIFLLQRGGNTLSQLKEVSLHFGIVFSKETFMTRCSLCNTFGFEGPLSSSEISVVAPGVVPEKVRQSLDEYFVCLNNKCRKVFWRGPTYTSTKGTFLKMFEAIAGDD